MWAFLHTLFGLPDPCLLQRLQTHDAMTPNSSTDLDVSLFAHVIWSSRPLPFPKATDPRRDEAKILPRLKRNFDLSLSIILSLRSFLTWKNSCWRRHYDRWDKARGKAPYVGLSLWSSGLLTCYLSSKLQMIRLAPFVFFVSCQAMAVGDTKAKLYKEDECIFQKGHQVIGAIIPLQH